MTYIEDLLKEHCPNGVEWKTLGEVCEFRRGQSLTSRRAIPGDVPVISGGQKPAFMHNISNREGETIVVAGSGAYAGFVSYWKQPIFVADAFSVDVKDFDKVSTRYVYHFLLNNQQKIYNTKTGAGIPHVYGRNIANFKLPLPPLKIQKEIVKILDKFTEYVTELTAELTLRKKQYSFYRDQLLSFENEVYQVEWKTLGEILVKGRGTKVTARQMKELHKDGAPIRIFAGGKTFADVDYGDIPEKDVHHEEAIIVKSRGIIDFEYYTKSFSFKNEFWSYSSDSEDVNLRYVYHYLNHNKSHFQHIAGNMQMPQISSNDTEKYKIPLPTKTVQSRIVQVLDNFDAVCNDLNIGLPKEIELRQKQYEFFRNQLLTFTAEGVYTDSTVQYSTDKT
ncbi:restriction endonuclease subunit S [Streptococcus hyointestinalis]